MVRQKRQESTRQLYASIREDLYLSAKARAAELRVPLRELLETALELVLTQGDQATAARRAPTVWDDEYLGLQASRPLGSAVELTKEEAERVVRASFGVAPGDEPLEDPNPGSARSTLKSEDSDV